MLERYQVTMMNSNANNSSLPGRFQFSTYIYGQAKEASSRKAPLVMTSIPWASSESGNTIGFFRRNA
jgi:hypothetical protein